MVTFVVTGLLNLTVAVRDQLPRRRASSVAVLLLGLLGVALMLAYQHHGHHKELARECGNHPKMIIRTR